MTALRITVIGAGVIGLSTAWELERAGHVVTVVSDLDSTETVSAVAGALWFPHASERSDAATLLLDESRPRFDELGHDPATGVLLRPGTIIERSAHADRSWMRLSPDAVELPPESLPPGATAAVRATLPIIHMPTYLGWLRAGLVERGVTFELRRIVDVDELAQSAEVVVVAAGLRGGTLLGDDDSGYPLRGQVVRLENPGLTEWISDDENPAGLIYVFPRLDDIVVGGTGDANEWDTTVDERTEAAILERAIRLVPELAGLAVVSRAVGLRPVRATIRLEVVAGRAIPTIAAYGHGGAGVTLSWGTAIRVVRLVEGLGLVRRLDGADG